MRGARSRISCSSGSFTRDWTNAVAVVVHRGRSAADRTVRLRHVRLLAKLHPAARYDREGRCDVGSADVPAAVPQLRHARIAGGQPHRRCGRHRPRRHPLVRDPKSRIRRRSIYQQGTYAPDADHRWMGSAAMDSAGNIALGFSVSGAVDVSVDPLHRPARERSAERDDARRSGSDGRIGIADCTSRDAGVTTARCGRSGGRLHVLVHAGVLRGRRVKPAGRRGLDRSRFRAASHRRRPTCRP